MWSGKSLQLLCIVPFGMLCLSATRMMFVKIPLALRMFVGIVVLGKLCPGRFLVVCECSSGLL